MKGLDVNHQKYCGYYAKYHQQVSAGIWGMSGKANWRMSGTHRHTHAHTHIYIMVPLCFAMDTSSNHRLPFL